MNALRCMVTVRAGLFPGNVTWAKTWNWTSEQQAALEGDDREQKTKAHAEWLSMIGESRETAAWLENPGQFNWVERVWTWL